MRVKALRGMSVVVAALLAATLTVVFAGSANAATKTSHGYWVAAGPHKGDSHAQFFGPIDHNGTLVWCSDPYKPATSVILRATTAKIPNLKAGGSAIVKTLLNKHAASATTTNRGAALAFDVFRESAERSYQADYQYYRNHLPASVIRLADRWFTDAKSHHGPFKATDIHFSHSATSVGVSNTGSGKLTASGGSAVPGVRPQVACSNAAVSRVTTTDSQGVYTFRAAKQDSKWSSCHVTFTLPSWSKSLTGSVSGYQHLSTGHYNVHVTASGGYGFSGTSVSWQTNCPTNCGTSVPIVIKGTDACGADSVHMVLYNDDANDAAIGSVDFAACSQGVAKTILVPNGDGKHVHLEWWFVNNGQRVGSKHVQASREIICPPGPDVQWSIEVDCNCQGTATPSAMSPKDSVRTYQAVEQMDGQPITGTSATLVNGVWTKLPVMTIKSGHTYALVISTTAGGKAYTWSFDPTKPFAGATR